MWHFCCDPFPSEGGQHLLNTYSPELSTPTGLSPDGSACWEAWVFTLSEALTQAWEALGWRSHFMAPSPSNCSLLLQLTCTDVWGRPWLRAWTLRGQSRCSWLQLVCLDWSSKHVCLRGCGPANSGDLGKLLSLGLMGETMRLASVSGTMVWHVTASFSIRVMGTC